MQFLEVLLGLLIFGLAIACPVIGAWKLSRQPRPKHPATAIVQESHREGAGDEIPAYVRRGAVRLSQADAAWLEQTLAQLDDDEDFDRAWRETW